MPSSEREAAQRITELVTTPIAPNSGTAIPATDVNTAGRAASAKHAAIAHQRAKAAASVVHGGGELGCSGTSGLSVSNW